jgi:hypothetical protein
MEDDAQHTSIAVELQVAQLLRIIRQKQLEELDGFHYRTLVRWWANGRAAVRESSEPLPHSSPPPPAAGRPPLAPPRRPWARLCAC